MPDASLRRKIFACLLLVTVLAVPWASAADRAAPAPPDLLHRTWSFFMSLWIDEGCHIDPNGLCGLPQILPDEGCNVDPNGRCGKRLAAPSAPLVLPDTGCHIDPDGRCGAS
jgi:hypothetical protein